MCKRKAFPIYVVFVGLLLLACGLTPPTPEPDLDKSSIYTQAAKTVVVELTRQAPPTATPTPFVAVPDDTLEPTATATDVPTMTPTITATPLACDAIQHVGDVSVEDGALFTPSSRFTKIWRFKNVGACTWTADYDLVFVNGDKIGAQTTIPLGIAVRPGETVDIYLDLQAPDEAGYYKGFWMLRNAKGQLFGLGDDYDTPFRVAIEVIAANEKYKYDFAVNYCQAVWQSDRNTDLPCPGTANAKGGFVVMVNDPVLENKHENEPTLWMHPNEASNGWVRGIFPAIDVQNGDRFVAWVGCMDESEGCKVIFRLQYRIGSGKIQTLKAWEEKFDGQVTRIDLDLSSLAGKSVQFILRVEINGGKPANADVFWFVPRIER